MIGTCFRLTPIRVQVPRIYEACCRSEVLVREYSKESLAELTTVPVKDVGDNVATGVENAFTTGADLGTLAGYVEGQPQVFALQCSVFICSRTHSTNTVPRSTDNSTAKKRRV